MMKKREKLTMDGKYIEKEALYREIAELENLARNRVIDTPTSSPAYMRYVTQLNERSRFKYKIADFPCTDVIEKIRKGKWIMRGGWFRCSECDQKALLKESDGTGGFYEYEQVKSNYCPNCGAKMMRKV